MAPPPSLAWGSLPRTAVREGAFTSPTSSHVYHYFDIHPPPSPLSESPTIAHGLPPAPSPTILLLHGFPDLGIGWRPVLPRLAEMGFRCIVPDQLGYGGSSKPYGVEKYALRDMCVQVGELLDEVVGVGQKVIVVGHDCICTPFTPASSRYLPVEEVARRAPSLSYQVFFASDDSTEVIEQNLHTFFSQVFKAGSSSKEGEWVGRQPDALLNGSKASPTRALKLGDGTVLSDEEMTFYLDTFRAGGMRGPLNWYRTRKINFEQEKNIPPLPPTLPALFVLATADPALVPSLARNMTTRVPGVEMAKLEGCGHWAMLERGDECARIIGEWAGRVAEGKANRQSGSVPARL